MAVTAEHAPVRRGWPERSGGLSREAKTQTAGASAKPTKKPPLRWLFVCTRLWSVKPRPKERVAVDMAHQLDHLFCKIRRRWLENRIQPVIA